MLSLTVVVYYSASKNYICSDKVLKSCRELCKQPALKRLYYMIMLYRLERLVFW